MGLVLAAAGAVLWARGKIVKTSWTATARPRRSNSIGESAGAAETATAIEAELTMSRVYCAGRAAVHYLTIGSAGLSVLGFLGYIFAVIVGSAHSDSVMWGGVIGMLALMACLAATATFTEHEATLQHRLQGR